MGGTLSSSKYGHLFLKLEKSYFYTGETVSGTIYISTIQNFPGNTIILKIKGTEYT